MVVFGGAGRSPTRLFYLGGQSESTTNPNRTRSRKIVSARSFDFTTHRATCRPSSTRHLGLPGILQPRADVNLAGLIDQNSDRADLAGDMNLGTGLRQHLVNLGASRATTPADDGDTWA